MKSTCLLIAVFMTATLVAQFSFTDETSRLVYTTQSGCAIGVSDMNGDGLDDIVRLDNARYLYIDYQQPDGTFTGYAFGAISTSKEWGLAIADVDQNGYNDIVAGGAYNDLKLLVANATGTTYTSSDLPPPDIFLQASNFVDINNDGAIDYFACHDDGVSSPYRGNNTGTFVHDTSLIYAETAVPSDNSGNYGTVWTDYDSDGDIDMYLSKCRLGVSDPSDGRRMNQLWENDGSNNYNDVADHRGLRPLAQSWAADFGDLDNDGDMDCFVINHDMISQLYENDGTNNYTNVTAVSGMTFDLAGLIGIQVVMDDFDNDGLLDILFTSYTNNTHRLFRNLGNLTFQNDTSAFPTGPGMQSAAIGDLNRDGFLDIVAGFANGFNSPSSTTDDVLYMNAGNDNHWIAVRLEGTLSNVNGIGARIETFSDLGHQIREVRSGESYGIMNTMNTHIGLGPDTMIDSLIVRWPSGTVDKWLHLDVDQFLMVQEGSGPCDCSNPTTHEVTNINDTGAGSLRDKLDQACPCDTITFAPSLAGESVELISRALRLDKPIVIDGALASPLTLEIENYNAAIHVHPGISAELHNLIIKDIEDGPLTPMIMITNCGKLTLNQISIITQSNLPPGTFAVGNYGHIVEKGMISIERQ